MVDDATVAEGNNPVRPRGKVGIVGDDHRPHTTVARLSDQLHHGLSVRRVERPRRFVREEEMALPDHGAGNGDSLTLAARKLVGKVPRPVGEVELLERRHSGSMRPLCRKAVELQWQGHVLEGREPDKQVEVLKNITNRASTEPCLVVSRQARDS